MLDPYGLWTERDLSVPRLLWHRASSTVTPDLGYCGLKQATIPSNDKTLITGIPGSTEIAYKYSHVQIAPLRSVIFDVIVTEYNILIIHNQLILDNSYFP